MRMVRYIAPVGLALLMSGCSLSGLLGGGKPPVTLQTLTSEAADPGLIQRTVNAAQAVTVTTPTVPKELKAVRVPVALGATDIQYVTGLQWVDTPDKLFQSLLEETIRRTTTRVVLDSRQAALDPGLLITGQLQRFGYDAGAGQVVVVYDASLSTEGGSRVENRRFVANAPSDGSGPAVGAALNRAANAVALDVAKWVGG